MTKVQEPNTQIEDWVTAWFVRRSKISQQEAAHVRHIDYFDAGWLTSMEVVELVTETEQQFGIQFSDLDLQDHRFVTIGGLGELVTERWMLMKESA
jgi:acyl carrier protein